jgi:amino acid transporter
MGAVSLTFAEYFLRVLRVDGGRGRRWSHWVAAAAIVLTSTINYRGARAGARVQNLTTVAKYGGSVFIILLAFALGCRARAGTSRRPRRGELRGRRVRARARERLWAFDGWADLSFVAGEVEDPRRTLPRALVLGTLAVIAVYLLANLAYLAVLPVEEIRRSKLVAADVAERLVGAPGVAFVAATVMLSTFGTLNGTLLTAPRIFFAMADDGLFFRPVARVHARHGSPYVAIVLTAALGVVFVLLRSFEQLADAFVTAILPFYALGVASVFRLRRGAAGTAGSGGVVYDPPFRVPGYPVVPLLFVAATLYLLVNALLDPVGRWATAGTLGVVVAGVPVYYLTVGRRGRGGGRRM